MEQQVGVVREQRPGVDDETGVLNERGQSGNEVGAVYVFAEDGAPLDLPAP